MMGIYSMGLCGYEVEILDGGEEAHARFIAPDKSFPWRKYKVNTTFGGRAFIRPDRRRVYLDRCMRVYNNG